MAIPTIGEKLIDCKLLDLEGGEHRLSEYTGKYLLISFWSMTCMICMKAAQDLKKIYSKYDGQLTVVSINMDTAKSAWEQGTGRDGIAWANLSDGQGTAGGAGAAYGVVSYPAYVLFSPDGVIVDRWMGYKSGRFEEKMQEHLKT